MCFLNWRRSDTSLFACTVFCGERAFLRKGLDLAARHVLLLGVLGGDKPNEWNDATGSLLIACVSGCDLEDARPEGSGLLCRQVLAEDLHHVVHNLDSRCWGNFQVVEPARVGGSAAIGSHLEHETKARGTERFDKTKNNCEPVVMP